MKSSRHSSQSASASRRGSSKNRSSRPGSGGKSNGAASKAEPSFWQKIVSKLTGRSAAPAAGSRSDSGRVSTHPATVAAQRSSRSSSSDSASSAGNDSSPSASRPSSRKPEVVEVTTPRLYVGNLSFDASEGDLTELFKGVGQVVSVEVVSHKQTQRSKGFAFVQMQSVEEAKRAVMELHDKEFMNRKLVVSGAKNSDQHDGRSEPRFAA
jgi:hypothetical protein